MHKEFVPHEPALELKELGFDEPCFAYYDEEDNTGQIYEYANCSGNVTGDKACYNDNFLSVTNSQLDKYGAFCSKDEEGEESYERWTAPTFSQAFRWFREKYKLNAISPTRIYKTDFYQARIVNWNNWEEINTKQCDSYEEAELACLIKLIQIVKDGNK